MPNERLELTFTGLCVLVIKGPAGTANPSNVQVIIVKDPMHLPRLSFRGIDLGNVTKGDGDNVPIQVAPDGQETIEFPIPSGAAIDIAWKDGAVDTKNSMVWDNSPTSMLKVPDLSDFNVTEVFLDGTDTAATLTLPFGGFEARRIVRGRDGDLLWNFDGENDPRVYANQVTLVSEAAQGKVLEIRFPDRTFSFLSGDGEVPISIAVTNLPAMEQLIEPEIGEGETPPHIKAYEGIAKSITGQFRTFSRTLGATRQGTICPSVRAHV